MLNNKDRAQKLEIQKKNNANGNHFESIEPDKPVWTVFWDPRTARLFFQNIIGPGPVLSQVL